MRNTSMPNVWVNVLRQGHWQTNCICWLVLFQNLIARLVSISEHLQTVHTIKVAELDSKRWPQNWFCDGRFILGRAHNGQTAKWCPAPTGFSNRFIRKILLWVVRPWPAEITSPEHMVTECCKIDSVSCSLPQQFSHLCWFLNALVVRMGRVCCFPGRHVVCFRFLIGANKHLARGWYGKLSFWISTAGSLQRWRKTNLPPNKKNRLRKGTHKMEWDLYAVCVSDAIIREKIRTDFGEWFKP